MSMAGAGGSVEGDIGGGHLKLCWRRRGSTAGRGLENERLRENVHRVRVILYFLIKIITIYIFKTPMIHVI